MSPASRPIALAGLALALLGGPRIASPGLEDPAAASDRARVAGAVDGDTLAPVHADRYRHGRHPRCAEIAARDLGPARLRSADGSLDVLAGRLRRPRAHRLAESRARAAGSGAWGAGRGVGGGGGRAPP